MTKSKKHADERMAYDQRVQQAVDGIRSGIYKSSYDAASQLNVKVSTVQHRMKGRKIRVQSHEDDQAPSPTEESELVRWITQLTITGYPPRHSIFRAMAEALRKRRVAQINDSGIELVHYRPLGTEWYKRFRNRHPEIDTTIGHSIEMNRMKDMSKEVLQAWFDTFQAAIKFYNIKSEHIYNMDESGFSIRQIEASRVIINKEI